MATQKKKSGKESYRPRIQNIICFSKISLLTKKNQVSKLIKRCHDNGRQDCWQSGAQCLHVKLARFVNDQYCTQDGNIVAIYSNA